jgi:DNA repair exonuclease SbcCD ATPase subunit
MIIKKIILENFQCYYDIKEFDLKPGLNIILGDNGD